MLSFSQVVEALTGLIYHRPWAKISLRHTLPEEDEDEEGKRREDSDVDFEASRRSTREQSKSTIRSALFLAKH